MLSIENKFREALSKEVVLFTDECAPYYVSPTVPKAFWSKEDSNPLIDEITRIVCMLRTLRLNLSYSVTLKSSPLGFSLKCIVSKFGHGYKAILIGDDIDKTRVNATHENFAKQMLL